MSQQGPIIWAPACLDSFAERILQDEVLLLNALKLLLKGA